MPLSKNTPPKRVISGKQPRKKDALSLASLIYDIYKTEKASGNIGSGQNNANQSRSN
jgi:hypothetical protein